MGAMTAQREFTCTKCGATVRAKIRIKEGSVATVVASEGFTVRLEGITTSIDCDACKEFVWAHQD
jgi:hypothetical protein